MKIIYIKWLFLGLLLPFSMLSQNTLEGTVLDKETGEVISGVDVFVQGAENAFSTDDDGKFQLENIKKGDKIEFSYSGFRNSLVEVNGEVTVSFVAYKKYVLNYNLQKSVTIYLEHGETQLEEVVIQVGYGKQKKTDVTGAIQTIKMDEIEDLPVGNLATALVGRVLGVSVSGGTTRPGSKGVLEIRNPLTLSKDGGNTQPLYVIDGVLQTTADGNNDSTFFNNLDASEVESISFLKDASAAIYGARSAQGVVLIKTKRGKIGKAKFNYSGSYGVNDETYRTKMLNAYQFARYYNIMNGPNGNNQLPNDPVYNFSQDELNYFKTLHFNPLNDEWSSASNQRHTLNLSGGNDDATYFAGISYFTQGGNLSNLDYDKWSFRANTDINLTNNIKGGLQLSGYYTDQSKTFSKVGGENEENDYRRLLNASPFIPQYINGVPVQRLNTSAESQYHFGEINRLGNIATGVDNSTTINMYLQYQVPFVKGLEVKGAYARAMGNSRVSQIGTKFTIVQFQGVGDNGHIYYENDVNNVNTVIKANTYDNGNRLFYSNIHSLSEQYNLNLTYNKNFGLNTISSLFAIEKADTESSQEDVWKEDPLLSTNGQFNSAFGTIDGRTSASESGSLAYIGRINYSYDEKYLAEFLFRSDASTKFAPANYWGNFYSLSGGWIVSKEDFFKSSFFDYLKLRASVGLLGKDDTRAWLWRQRFTYQNGKGVVFGGNSESSTGIKMEASPNVEATWSDELKTNFGVEARFLNNRFSFNAESFYNMGTNILLERTGNVPFTVGGSVASENYGEVDFFGFEMALGWNDKIGDKFRYGINVNFDWSDNRMIKGNFNDADVLKPWNPKPGQSTDNGVWGYDYLGMFKTQADVDNYVSQYNITQVFGVSAANLRPGTLYYRDVRGAYLGNGEFAAPDGIINENDQIKLAQKRFSKYRMGTTLKLVYKDFSLNTVVTASFGSGWSEVDSQTRKIMKTKINDGIDNRPSIWNNIYDPVLNPNGTMPNPFFSTINLDPTSGFWERNSFRLQMRNISLNYTLPEKYIKYLKISSCRLNVMALNPFNLYNPFGYKNPIGAYDVYPELKTISLGFNVSF
jgi:TonB-linked SusC/RagA family outer membrane protein